MGPEEAAEWQNRGGQTWITVVGRESHLLDQDKCPVGIHQTDTRALAGSGAAAWKESPALLSSPPFLTSSHHGTQLLAPNPSSAT